MTKKKSSKVIKVTMATLATTVAVGGNSIVSFMDSFSRGVNPTTSTQPSPCNLESWVKHVWMDLNFWKMGIQPTGELWLAKQQPPYL